MPRRRRLRRIIGRTWARLVEPFISWNRRYRDRQLLESLNDRMLGDIGIDRAAVGDSTTAFWRFR